MALEKVNAQNEKEYRERMADLMQQRQTNRSMDENIEKEVENKETVALQEQYNLLFNKLLQVYTDWASRTKAYLPDKIDSGPRSKLAEPLEMLSIMERMIKISTNEKLQVGGVQWNIPS